MSVSLSSSGEDRLEAILLELYQSQSAGEAGSNELSSKERGLFKEQARALYAKTKDVEIDDDDVDRVLEQTMASVKVG